jgi:hypothetical protein
VIKDSTAPRICIMAVVTLRGRRYMIGWLTGSGRTIVAAAALANYLAVINTTYRAECIGVMAILTDIGRLNMRWCFTDRGSAIVATDTVAAD